MPNVSSNVVLIIIFLWVCSTEKHKTRQQPITFHVKLENLSRFQLELIFHSPFCSSKQHCFSLKKSKTVVKNLVKLFNATCHAVERLTQILLTDLKYPNELSGVSHAGRGLLVWKVIYKRQG